jgi:hypothetical protein
MDANKFDISIHIDEGSGVCEDSGGYTDCALWVIDGATTLTENHIEESETDGVWFVDNWEKELEKRIHQDRTLSDIVKDAIQSTRESYEEITDIEPSNRLETPAATTAIVRERAGSIEYFVLGDSSILFENHQGDVDAILGEGPRSYDQKAVDKLEQVMQNQNLTYKQAREEIQDMLRRHRKLENTASGYWTLGFDTDAVEHADTGRYASDQISSIYLFTDGFERIKSTFDVFVTWESLVEYIRTNGGDRAFEILRAFEKSDSECREYPRLSLSDDATLAYAERVDTGE